MTTTYNDALDKDKDFQKPVEEGFSNISELIMSDQSKSQKLHDAWLKKYLHETFATDTDCPLRDPEVPYNIDNDDLARKIKRRDLGMANLNEEEEEMINFRYEPVSIDCR